jgi:queuine tRNA-ribosyltransferase
MAMTPDGRLPLRRAVYRDDLRPIVDGCLCPACRRFSRAYIRHLFAAGEILGHRLLSLHNLTHLSALMAGAREAIAAGRFDAFRDAAETRMRNPEHPLADGEEGEPRRIEQEIESARVRGTLGRRG